ncbi:imidazole glycerol phosphate synthase subunit HisH [uncultured Sphaerochaeta sp.]|uniref:imidazole glycerol phosphate synthase subunit HisH n=1 Tax=uncultured Sphaerochaeta sp. TaxID=886478 RepID=UPI002A0A130F|nr:imidazole glycerol phosphate synthase subunit HisH [uncultured Sphaerochaeta sp.]
MNIAIVKYNAGNTRSVLCALHRLGYEATVTDDPVLLASADRVIFPGVGEASTAMEYLRKINLDGVLKSLKQPFLGICLGMQLMCSHSEENDAQCLGIFDVPIVKFPLDSGEKIPHMGWNTIDCKDDPLFSELKTNRWCYFVHSYYAPLCEETIASTTYAGITFSASLHKNNFWGCQFHPEKSGDVGERILAHFLEAL